MKHLKKFENYSQDELEMDEITNIEDGEKEETIFEIDVDDEDEDLEEEITEKKGVSYKKSGLRMPEKADLDKDGKIDSYEKARGKAIDKSFMDKIRKKAAEARYRKSLRSKPQD